MYLLKEAIKYAEDVINGKEITTWEVKKQCEIFLHDYNVRQYEEEFEFYFDEDKLELINNLLKLFNYATGFVAGLQVYGNLASFQCFLIANVFGWRFKDNPLKFRYREITLFIARKNAKTFLVGLIFLLLMLTEQKFSEGYSICLNKDLAAEIRKAMAQILEASPLISKHFKVSKSIVGRITCTLTGSYFEPRVNQSGKNNSIRPSFFVGDEFANFKEASNFNAMKSGQKNVVNPVLFRTTTAYAIDNSIMLPELEYIRKVYNGVVKNERMFALLYYSDKENLWSDIGLYMANPLRNEDNYNEIREDREKALVKPEDREEYLTKAMNYFVPENMGLAYVTAEQIQACIKDDLDFDWNGRSVFVGADFAETDDNTGISMLTYDEENDRIVGKVWSFIPIDKVESKSKLERFDYKKAISDENCFGCGDGDGIISYKFINNFIIGLQDKYGVTIEIFGFDRRNGRQTAQWLEREHYIEHVDVEQGSRVLSPTIKRLKELVMKKKILFDGSNKMLEANFVNCKEVKDTLMNPYIHKKKSIESAGKVDMVFSIFDALYCLDDYYNNGNYNVGSFKL